MNGYIKNISPIWTHALKRSIRPGGKVSLDELYEQYGKKHNIREGQEFVDWLREVKLKDKNRWEILLQDDKTVKSEESEEVKKSVKKAVTNIDSNLPEQTSSKVPNKGMSVESVVELSVRKAMEAMPKITDLKLLQYSLKEAETRAGKDSLCRVIRKRIKQLQLAKAG